MVKKTKAGPASESPAGAQAPITKDEFGRKLRRLILERGWNQSDLARRANQFLIKPTDRSSISVYCLGKSFPGPTHLHALARALDMEMVDLLPNVAHDAAALSSSPAFEMRTVPGEPDTVWLKVNQGIRFDQAIKIMQVLKEG